MNQLSKGTRFALLFLLAITLLGLALGISDYARHADASTFWWPAITAAIFVLVLFLGKRTDIAPALALPLLLAAAASCQRGPDREHQAETRTAARADTVRPADTYAVLDSGGFERAVTVRHGW